MTRGDIIINILKKILYPEFQIIKNICLNVGSETSEYCGKLYYYSLKIIVKELDEEKINQLEVIIRNLRPYILNENEFFYKIECHHI